MVAKLNKNKIKKQNKINRLNKNKKNGIKLGDCIGAGCRACGNPTYPDCIDSCPLFDT